MQRMMRCIRVAEFGGPQVLRLANDVPIPTPACNQVVIQVHAAGVNPVDTYIRNGTHSIKPPLPFTPGKDGGGIVHSVGESVTKVMKGDRVWFWGSVSGSYAEYSLCDENLVGHLPVSMSYEEGAMIGTPYLTAYRALHDKAHLKPFDTVMIHGATGGVGTAAIQLCKIFGANIIATAGSSQGEEMLRDMDVDRIYNHRTEGYVDVIQSVEKKIDVILEMLANVNLENDLKMISQNGRIIVIGCRGSTTVNPRLMMGKESTVVGCALFKSTEEESVEAQRYIQECLEGDMLKPFLWKVYRLEDAVEAHKEIIENSGSKGQMVLKIDRT